MKLIGYEQVSNQSQEIDRQIEDKLAAGVRRDDLCRDRGVSGAGPADLVSIGPGFPWKKGSPSDYGAEPAGRSTMNMLGLLEEPRGEVALRVLNMGGGIVDTATPTGSMVFTVMAAQPQMELEIKRIRFARQLIRSQRGSVHRHGTIWLLAHSIRAETSSARRPILSISWASCPVSSFPSLSLQIRTIAVPDQA